VTDTDLSNLTETRADLIDLGAALHDRRETFRAEQAPDVATALVPPGYSLVAKVIDPAVEALRPAPRRVRSDVTVTDTASWLAYYAKHKTAGSEVFGDVATSTVTAVLNAPESPTAPAWGDHRLSLKLEHSPAWEAWTKRNGALLTQTAFAEHIEDRTPDLVDPDAATMLEVAQSIRATTGVKFESGVRLHDGQRRFTYAETVESKAGQRGELSVPTMLSLRLQVWRGVPIAVDVTARFRFRIDADGLRLAFVLDRLEDVLDAAWTNLLGDLTKGIDVPVLAGRAPNYGGR
jgi:uncharacterized protein YfdQ (DUF2303 family)